MKYRKGLSSTSIAIFENWSELTWGYYRFVISSGACYEIIVTQMDTHREYETAKANLYITGVWRGENSKEEFTREILAENTTIDECLKAALADYEENVTVM